MTVPSVFLKLTTRNTTITGTHRNSQPIAAVSFPQFFARRITNIWFNEN